MGKRGIAMMWDHAEVNPFVKGSGTLTTINTSILDGINYSIKKLSQRGNISILNISITHLENKTSLIVCDPPYYDDVQYAELSEFFFVWERKALEKIYRLEDVQKSEDMSVGGNRDINTFKKLLKLTYQQVLQQS